MLRAGLVWSITFLAVGCGGTEEARLDHDAGEDAAIDAGDGDADADADGDADPPGCGDGVLDDDEACDDGNEVDTDGCLSDCTEARCGDGVVFDGREACDD